MSIANEIVRLQNAKSALKNAINPKLKETTTPIGNETLDQYANFLNEIPLYAKASKVYNIQEMNALTDMEEEDFCIVKGAPSEDHLVYQYLNNTWVDVTDTILVPTTNVTPTTSAQTIPIPAGYKGLKQVNVAAVTDSIDANITASNIRSGVTILGVTGNLIDYSSGMEDIKEILDLDPSASEQDVVNAVENLKQTSEETLEAAEAIADLIIEGSEEQLGGEE